MKRDETIYKNIGILVDSVEDNCEYEICEGIKKYSHQTNSNICIFEGVNNLHYSGLDNQYSVIKDFILNSKLDGLIMLTGYMLEQFKTGGLKKYINSFTDLPIVSVSLIIEGIPSIISDNKKGINDLVNHLVDIHCSNILGFISGPEYHIESSYRLNIFKESLSKRQISFSKNNFVYAKSLTRQGGYKAAKKLLGGKATSLPDAIVCCDDYLALGVIEYLTERKIRIPDDIIVSGFDDIKHSDITLTPLTTIKQSFFDIGYKALEQLFYLIKSNETDDLTIIDTKLIIRNSCGCFNSDSLTFKNRNHYYKNNSSHTKSRIELKEEINIHLASMSFLLEEPIEIIKSLFDSVLNINNLYNNSKVHMTITSFIEENIEDVKMIKKIRDVLKYVLNIIYNLYNNSNTLTYLFQKILEIIDDFIIGDLTMKNSYQSSFTWKYNIGNQLLLNAYNLSDLTDEIYKILPDMKINSFYLCIYKTDDIIYSPVKWTLPEYSELIVAYNKNKKIIGKRSIVFKTKDILPKLESISKDDVRIFITISFKREHIGYMLIDYNSDEFKDGYGFFRINIGTAVRNALLVKKMDQGYTQKIDFFVNISHEIKTPLTITLNAFDSYIRKHGLNTDLKILKFNLNKLKKDIVNFMDLEKLEKGLLLYNHEQFVNFSNILHLKKAQFSETALKRGVKFESEIDEDIYLKIDPFALDRIINNLIENAIKYNSQDGIIKITLKSNNTNIILEISDTGVGLSLEDIKNIFKPYFQIYREKRNFQGLGMGLFIIKKILNELNAKITVKSILNKGSSFFVSFIKDRNIDFNNIAKIEEPEQIILADKIDKTELKNNNNDNNNMQSILIIDDNEQMLYFLKQNLSKFYNVYIAKNGIKALAVLRQMPKPVLIITDIIMDTMNGYEFIEELYNTKDNQNIPIIFLTAKTTINDKIKALTKGGIDLISKPFMIDELILKVNNLVLLSEKQQDIFINDFETSLFKTLEIKKASNQQAIINRSLNRLCDIYSLSEKEIDVMRHIHTNLKHKQISYKMNLTEQTVRNISHIIYQKCFVSNKKELIQLINKF